MNFDQFASSFQNPEGATRCGEYKAETQPDGDVVLAGTILFTTDDSCCININGAQYEIASSDVIDIQTLSPAASPAGEKTGADEPPADGVPKEQQPQTVLVKVNKGAILICRTPVPATLLAAVGTWMQVVFSAAKAA